MPLEMSYLEQAYLDQMSEKNIDPDFFNQGIAELEENLLSKEIYWNLPGLPRLSISGLLLIMVKLLGKKLLLIYWL